MPLDPEIIKAQLGLLASHRRRLALLLQQQAKLGAYTPPYVLIDIQEAQSAIHSIKEQLRSDGGPVEDEPNDDVQPAAVAAPSRLSPQEQRNRGRMLDRVETFWIKGVLEQSLYQVARLELGLEYSPAQVSHPWETVLQQANQPNQTIPPEKSAVAIFDELLGELLILGAPGAGKTTVLLEITRELIARARNNEEHPIPIVFNLSTWSTKRQPLKEWLVGELNQRYDVPKALAEEFVNENAVLPLLDGLDEVAAEHRDACVEAINEYRKAYGFVPLAVCSRIADYEALSTKLRLQGAIVLQPLTKAQVDDYLKRVGRPLAAVRAALRDDPTLWELMDNPLILTIVALAYKDTSAAKLRASGIAEERRKQLFDDYIAAMFARPGRSTSTAYPRPTTQHALAWLAAKMVEQQQTVLYIERMQPNWLGRWSRSWFAIRVGLLSALTYGLVGGLVFGLVFGVLGGLLLGLKRGWFFGPVIGLGSGLAFSLLYGGSTVLQHYTLRWVLYRNGSLPFLDLIPFLDYCVERIFLRKVGGGYIFVHRLLMEHFAGLERRRAE